MNDQLTGILERLMKTPTAPFREEWVGAVVDDLLADIPGLEVEVDRYGNRILRLCRGHHDLPPATFVAHLDHPGFVFQRTGAVQIACHNGSGYRYNAVFEGGVADRFFEDAAVRLFRSADDPGVAGRVLSASERNKATDNRTVMIETREPADGAMLAMWDLPAFSVSSGLVGSRACDDLAGVACIIEALRRLAETNGPVNVAAILSRAEEAGFCGVIAMLEEPALPALLSPDSVFISVEIPGETTAVRVGGGAIIRTGDKSSTYDGRVVDLLASMVHQRGVHARRALMDRGTCEATPFIRAGYRAGGVCAPVRNYHNMDLESGRLAPEMVSLEDLQAMVSLITLLAHGLSAGFAPQPVVENDYGLFLSKARQHLLATPADSVAAGAEG